MGKISKLLARKELERELAFERALLGFVGREVKVLTRYHWKDVTGVLESFGAHSGEYHWAVGQPHFRGGVGRIRFRTSHVVSVTDTGPDRPVIGVRL